ncbi:MAG: hypothetical protein HFI65_05155 [Lachnospiraceae bacterium]|nr:hypothetical protein [Lachnospiraceae bacterium]
MDNKKTRRNRLYHALIDTDGLKSGEKYTSLKNVYVIFIMPNDPFGAERMIYTVRTMCVEEPELPYHDGAQTLFLYTRGTKGNPPEVLRQLLRYMENSTAEFAVNENLRRLHQIVEAVKRNEEVELSYMKSWEWEEEIRREALEAGHAEGLSKGFAEGRAEGLSKGRVEGHAEGHAEGLAEGHAEGHAEGLAEGISKGREEERLNTEREKRRADLAESELQKLREELRRYQGEAD